MAVKKKKEQQWKSVELCVFDERFGWEISTLNRVFFFLFFFFWGGGVTRIDFYFYVTLLRVIARVKFCDQEIWSLVEIDWSDNYLEMDRCFAVEKKDGEEKFDVFEERRSFFQFLWSSAQRIARPWILGIWRGVVSLWWSEQRSRKWSSIELLWQEFVYKYLYRNRMNKPSVRNMHREKELKFSMGFFRIRIFNRRRLYYMEDRHVWKTLYLLLTKSNLNKIPKFWEKKHGQ